MRFHRIITAFLTLFVAAVMAAAMTTTVAASATSPVAASPATHASPASQMSPATKAKSRQKRPLRFYSSEIRNSNKFQVHGKVGHYKKRKVFLAQKKDNQRKWHRIKFDRTDRKGKFRINFDGRTGTCFRLEVPGDRAFRGKVAKIGCIVGA